MFIKLLLIVVIGALIITYVLGNYYFELNYYYPESISNFMIRFFAPENQEQIADIELFVNFIFSLLAMSCLVSIYLLAANILRTDKKTIEDET